MLSRRGFTAEILETDVNPLVYGELLVPGASRTILWYAHYDGQPFDPKLWKQESAFKPILRDGRMEDGAKEIPNFASLKTYPSGSRIYARSASDDKAPIVALLAAIETTTGAQAEVMGKPGPLILLAANARIGGGNCACGRGSTRLESVLGRTSDFVVTPAGGLLHGLFFMRAFYKAPVRQFRVVQETLHRISVSIVPGPEYNDDVRRRITSVIHAHGDPDFEVLWEVVEDIPPSAGGKFRYTISHVDRDRR